jgi:hypothetical protein
VVTVLLELGADATALEPTYRGTPLGWAKHCERSDAIEAFRRAGVVR